MGEVGDTGDGDGGGVVHVVDGGEAELVVAGAFLVIPVEGGAIVVDVADGGVGGTDTGVDGLDVEVVDIPGVAARTFVAHGSAGTGGGGGHGDLHLVVDVDAGIGVAVGLNRDEGGGVGSILDVAYLEGAIAGAGAASAQEEA